jgi:hypothetical protein
LKRILRSRPSPALVIACIALFVSLGGVSYGLATGSVDTRELKNNSVSTRDLRNNSATGIDIKNGSLLRRDFRAGQLPAGPPGPPGAPGATGRPGAPGDNGFGLLSYAGGIAANGSSVGVKTLDNGESAEGTVPCPDGTHPTGGDVWAVETATEALVPEHRFLVASFFDIDAANVPNGWFASLDNSHGVEITVLVEAICANASQVQTPAATAIRRSAPAK